MKTTILKISSIFLLYLLIGPGCVKDYNKINLIKLDGYIVGFDPCTINHHYRIGYVIISTNLKITLEVDEKELLEAKILKQADAKTRNPVYAINTRLEMGVTDEFLVRFNENVAQTSRDFCIILKNNADSLWTFSLPENICDFPPGVIKSGHDAFSGGPYFPPDSLRYKFNIRFRYRQPEKSEVLDCPLAFNTMGVSFSWKDWNGVIVEDVS